MSEGRRPATAGDATGTAAIMAGITAGTTAGTTAITGSTITGTDPRLSSTSGPAPIAASGNLVTHRAPEQ
jgi:hypothetical protein